MALHVSGKLCVIGLVLASLITAFGVPPEQEAVTSLHIDPRVQVLSEPAVELPTAAMQAHGPNANPRYVLRATGYNSLVNQTDSTPNITATGARTRFGIIAVSRDLLDTEIPYGSLVRIKDLGSYYSGRGYGKYQGMLDHQGLFIVEDTMHRRKRQQVDVWFRSYSQALNWGVRQVEVEVVRYGRYGPTLQLAAAPSELKMMPKLAHATPE